DLASNRTSLIIKKAQNYGIAAADQLPGDLMQEEVTGTVTDSETGESLAGVNILLKETSRGTTTDLDGNYALTVPTDENVLVFSYVGYQPQEVEVDGRTEINIALVARQVLGDDLIVVGYGTQERINLTGAVGVTRSERLENRSVASVGEGLQGVIPNLNVTVPSGDPADSPSFNIRGYESITGGSPLILVDGIPMDINRINPNDIESVSVLKDAAAAAVYGARAAFGVILVETKKAQRGERLNVTLNSQFSAAKPIFNMDVVTDPHQYVLARNRASMRTNGTPAYDEDMVEGTRRWVEDPTDANAWGVVDGELRYYGYNEYQSNLMTDYAPTDQHDLSISGGSENASYYASFGRLNKDGYLRHDANENFKRYNARLEAEFQVADWLSLKERIQFNSENSDKPYFYSWSQNVNSVARVSPIVPMQFPDLDHYLEPGDRDDYEQYVGMYFENAIFFPYLDQGGRSTYTNNDTWLTQEVTLTPIENLTIQSDFSYNIFTRDLHHVRSRVETLASTDLTNPSVVYGYSSDDWIENQNTNNNYYVFNVFGEYKVEQFENHDITGMVGFNQERGQNRYISAMARSLITPNITDMNATTGAQQASSSSSHVALRGAFYRLNYMFKQRYLLEANGRYDGTSRFPKEDRFGFFPSFSAGWIISNENFMSGTSGILDMLKIRASYGTLGNQSLGSNYYPHISTLGSGQSNYVMGSGFIPTVSPAGLVSPTLTWESVTSRNLGLDITMFDGKFDVVFDIYTRDTKDMLMGVDYPVILGTSAPEANAANLRTSGWELELNWRQVVNNDLQYNIGIALSDWTAVITNYENPNNSLGDYYEGQKLGEIWGYETIGIFQEQSDVDNHADQSQLGSNWRAGDIQYADLNGDGEINPGSNTLEDPGDRKVIGNSNPRGSFGINTGVNFKNFHLSTFFQGVMQRDHWPTSGNHTWFFPFNAQYVENYFITDTWTEDNRDAYFPAAHVSTSDKKNLATQSRYMQNAGYIRLKNITLSYDLPGNLSERIGLSHAQIYFTGMNLWEYSPIRKPLDAETIYSGPVTYPMQRIFTMGTRISL
ncbi:MAG: TonB-dependent receptor, partial [Balneolales bacterium]